MAKTWKYEIRWKGKAVDRAMHKVAAMRVLFNVEDLLGVEFRNRPLNLVEMSTGQVIAMRRSGNGGIYGVYLRMSNPYTDA